MIDFLNTIYKFVFDNVTEIIAFFVTLSAYAFIFWPKLFFRESFTQTYREQLDKAYYPMFKILLPYLYKDVGKIPLKNLVQDLLKIVDEHYVLIDSILINELEILNKENIDHLQESYNLICDRVCRLFDKTRAYLGMPVRAWEYRLNHRQFSNRIFMWMQFISYMLLHLFLLLLAAVIIFGLSSKLLEILQSTK